MCIVGFSLRMKIRRIYGITAPSLASTFVNYVGIDLTVSLIALLSFLSLLKLEKQCQERDMPVVEDSILIEE